MSDEWVALVGLRYPNGDAEYEQAAAGKPYEQCIVAAGEPCANIPAKSVAAYLAMGRPVIAKAKKGAKV